MLGCVSHYAALISVLKLPKLCSIYLIGKAHITKSSICSLLRCFKERFASHTFREYQQFTVLVIFKKVLYRSVCLLSQLLYPVLLYLN